MKIQTGETYQSSEYAKTLAASASKVGKTAFLVGSALGVLPWMKSGGIVDNPKNLWVITFDANALGHMNKFLRDTCGASQEALSYNVINLQDDMRRTSESEQDYNTSFYSAVLEGLDYIAQRAKGVPVVLFSSLTGLAQGIERGIVGPPRTNESGGNPKGYSDPSKWQMIAHQLNEIRNFGQVDKWHCIWEAHIDKAPTMNMGGAEGANQPKEGIMVSGKSGRNWGYNVEQIFSIHRMSGQKYAGTKCDQVYVNTRPALDFIASSRGSTELLDEKEANLAVAYKKLHLKVGHWGAKSAPPKPTGTPVRKVVK